MMPYDLPTTLNVGGKDYEIRTDYRAILDIIYSQNDPDLSRESKAEVMLEIMYPDYESIPPGDLAEALEKAVWFIDCGQDMKEAKNRPKLMDWEQDAQMIITAINAQIQQEVRSVPYMHWWTFFGYYMSIGESLFSTVVSIRSKRAHGKKLEKYENDFLRENRDLVIFKTREGEEEREEAERQKQEILRFLDGGR